MPKIPRRKALNPYHFHSQLTTKLLSITELANSWEQLGLLAEVADLFYSNIDPQYQELYEQFQNSARRLAALAPAGHHFDQGGIAGPCCDPGLNGEPGPPGCIIPNCCGSWPCNREVM